MGSKLSFLFFLRIGWQSEQSCSPLFVLQVSAAVVEEDVAVFSQSSFHHPNAAVEEALELRGVEDLLPLLLCQLPQHRKQAY